MAQDRHAVIAVVCPQLQELRQILVPDVQIDRHCALADAQLVDGDRSVVDDADPADHTAARAFKAADAAAPGTHFAQVHAGEFYRLLKELSPDEEKLYAEGAEEVEEEIAKAKSK